MLIPRCISLKRMGGSTVLPRLLLNTSLSPEHSIMLKIFCRRRLTNRLKQIKILSCYSRYLWVLCFILQLLAIAFLCYAPLFLRFPLCTVTSCYSKSCFAILFSSTIQCFPTCYVFSMRALPFLSMHSLSKWILHSFVYSSSYRQWNVSESRALVRM